MVAIRGALFLPIILTIPKYTTFSKPHGRIPYTKVPP